MGVALALHMLACSTPPKAPRPATEPSALRLAVVREALSLEGTPYRSGAADPDRGFDCSGFVHYLFRRHGVHLPRTARAMADALPPSRQPRPGDLLFFNTTGEAYSHVGLSIGNQRFIHASSSRGVQISTLGPPYWADRFLGVRSPLDEEDPEEPPEPPETN